MLSRPWVKGCDHPIFAQHQRYKGLTVWPDLDEDNRTWKQLIKYRLWHAFPQGVIAMGANYWNIRRNLSAAACALYTSPATGQLFEARRAEF